MEEKTQSTVSQKIIIAVCIIVCIILIPILVINLTIVIKAYIHPDDVPDFLGIKLFVVETDSMSPIFYGGDLIVTKTIAPDKLEVKDIISFREGKSVVTHRIEEITTKGNSLAFVTKGDANNAIDSGEPVVSDNVESVYLFRIAKLGRLAMFMQTPIGMLVFVGIPVIAFILYDILSRVLYNKKEDVKEKAASEEIERLKAELAKLEEEKKEDLP